MATSRGSFQFDAEADGTLTDSVANTERLRSLWLDRTMIDGDDLGPGNPGDFDDGAWHVGCHVVAGGGARRTRDGRLAWLELSHEPGRDEYVATVTAERNGRAETHALTSAAGKDLLAASTLLGFVEGNSTGHISGRGVADAPTRFNKWRRQDFDKGVERRANGGKVWEHWCTLRQIRAPDPVAATVLRAYVALTSALGDRFAPTVARGRREYGHPKQLAAMVRAGFTTAESATWEVQPHPIPPAAGRLFLEARPVDALRAAGQLSWDGTPRYYMFKRRIDRWSPASAVRHDLGLR